MQTKRPSYVVTRTTKKNISKKPKGGVKIPPLLPAYPGQVVDKLVITCTPSLLSTTVTTGVIAGTFLVRSSVIANFATRFGATFEEYRIVRARFVLRTFSSTNPGLFTHWIDEKDVTNPPTLAEAQQKSDRRFSCASPSPHVLTWTASDPLDLQYLDMATTTSVACYKIYTDNANFGSSAVATPYAEITASYWIQFRGWN